jgi:PAS domain S-box-containing protein
MKKYLILIPILLLVAGVIGFYMNKSAEIKTQEKELTKLKELSNELDLMFKNHNRLIEDKKGSINNDEVTQSGINLEHSINNYLEVLNTTTYERLYSLSKNIRTKTDALAFIYEDIKTDKAIVNNAIIWSVNDYEGYMKTKRSLSYADKAYINYLFKAIINKSYKGLVSLKAVRHTDELNTHLLMLQSKEQNLQNLHKEIENNDISVEINEVILFTYKTLETLRAETDSIIKNLLIGSTLLLLFALGMYAKAIQSLSEARKLKNELREFVDALDESSIVSKSDLFGKITYVNDKFCEISGYTREELIGKSHSLIRHPDMPEGLFKRLWTTIEANKIFKGTLKNRTKDGGEYVVETTIIPLHNEKGETVEYLSVRYDVTNYHTEFNDENQRTSDRGL